MDRGQRQALERDERETRPKFPKNYFLGIWRNSESDTRQEFSECDFSEFWKNSECETRPKIKKVTFQIFKGNSERDTRPKNPEVTFRGSGNPKVLNKNSGKSTKKNSQDIQLAEKSTKKTLRSSDQNSAAKPVCFSLATVHMQRQLKLNEAK